MAGLLLVSDSFVLVLVDSLLVVLDVDLLSFVLLPLSLDDVAELEPSLESSVVELCWLVLLLDVLSSLLELELELEL